MSEKSESLESARIAKIEALRERGIDPYPVKFEPTARVRDLHERFDHIEAGSETGEQVTVAGRLMLKRGHGKLVFGVLRDDGSDIQLFCQADQLGPDDFAQFEDFD